MVTKSFYSTERSKSTEYLTCSIAAFLKRNSESIGNTFRPNPATSTILVSWARFRKPYRYVPPLRVWFLSRFGLKTGIDFDHYGHKSGMIFKGTTGAYKRICQFSTPNEE